MHERATVDEMVSKIILEYEEDDQIISRREALKIIIKRLEREKREARADEEHHRHEMLKSAGIKGSLVTDIAKVSSVLRKEAMDERHSE